MARRSSRGAHGSATHRPFPARPPKSLTLSLAPARREPWDDARFTRGTNAQRLNKPIKVAFAIVLKLRLKPTTAADVSGATGSDSFDTANTVKM